VILEKQEEEAEQVTEENKKTKGKEKKEEKSRLLLLLDIPKMLAEKELLEFSTTVQETVKQKVDN
jgi:hypothetical protein